MKTMPVLIVAISGTSSTDSSASSGATEMMGLWSISSSTLLRFPELVPHATLPAPRTHYDFPAKVIHMYIEAASFLPYPPQAIFVPRHCIFSKLESVQLRSSVKRELAHWAVHSALSRPGQKLITQSVKVASFRAFMIFGLQGYFTSAQNDY